MTQSTLRHFFVFRRSNARSAYYCAILRIVTTKSTPKIVPAFDNFGCILRLC